MFIGMIIQVPTGTNSSSRYSESPKKYPQFQERFHSSAPSSVLLTYNQEADDELEAKDEEFHVADKAKMVRRSSHNVTKSSSHCSESPKTLPQFQERYHSSAPSSVLLTYNQEDDDESKEEEFHVSGKATMVWQSRRLSEGLPLHYLGDLASMLMPPKIVKDVIPQPAPAKYSSRRRSCGF